MTAPHTSSNSATHAVSTAHTRRAGDQDPLDDIPEGARALARLNASRRRLRRELLPPEPEHPLPEDGGGPPIPRRMRAMFRHWKYKLRHSALGGVALTAFQTWWHDHPLRVPGEALSSELRGAVVPLVRRHPVATVLLASAAGAALVAWKPWRWPVVARRIKPLPNSFGRWAMAQLSSPAVQSILATWLMSTFSHKTRAEPEDEMPGDEATGNAPFSPQPDVPATAAAAHGAPSQASGAQATPASPAQASHGAADPAVMPPAAPQHSQPHPPHTSPKAPAGSPGRPGTQAEADAGIPADA